MTMQMGGWRWPTTPGIIAGGAGGEGSFAAQYMARVALRNQQAARAGGGVGGMGGLFGQFADAWQQARAANESRYGDILGQYGDMYKRVMANLQGLGEQERKNIGQRFTERTSDSMQDLVSRGLRGTTIAPSVKQGLAREQEGVLAQLAETLRREQIGYDTGLTGQKLGFMERRTDAYPDMNLLAQLATMLGRGGGGGGWGGGINAPQKVASPFINLFSAHHGAILTEKQLAEAAAETAAETAAKAAAAKK
ncbi:MAG: hypothetical protein ABII00_06760 [Elusimicrobiota bacterium]